MLFCFTFAVTNNKKRNYMILKEIVEVSAVVTGGFAVSFTAKKMQTEKGYVFLEKNFAKDMNTLYSIAYLVDSNVIILQAGNFTLSFEVVDGNKEEFIGTYKTKFLGFDGYVEVVKK